MIEAAEGQKRIQLLEAQEKQLRAQVYSLFMMNLVNYTVDLLMGREFKKH